MIVLNFLDDRLIEPARASCLILFGVPIYLVTERCYPIKLFELRMKLMREYL